RLSGGAGSGWHGRDRRHGNDAERRPDFGRACHGARLERPAEGDQEERRDNLPGVAPHHAGLPPMARSVMRPATPTIATRNTATSEPATRAAHISMVWL